MSITSSVVSLSVCISWMYHMEGRLFWLLPVEAGNLTHQLEITVIVIHLGSQPEAIYCTSVSTPTDAIEFCQYRQERKNETIKLESV